MEKFNSRKPTAFTEGIWNIYGKKLKLTDHQMDTMLDHFETLAMFHHDGLITYHHVNELFGHTIEILLAHKQIQKHIEKSQTEYPDLFAHLQRLHKRLIK